MKIVKRILIVLAILILLVAAIGLLFFPAKVTVERSITINKKQSETYAFVSDLKNWNSWSPWYELDTAAKYEYINGSTGAGASLHWESPVKNVGKGTMTFSEVKPDSVVRLDLNFMEQGTAKSYYYVQPEGEGSKVSWGLVMDAGANPLLRIMGSFMDDMLGKDFDKGLNKLKVKLESMASQPDFKVEEMNVPSFNYMYVKDSADYQSIGAHLGQDYAMIGQALGKQKLQMAGPPMAIYHNGGQTAWSFDAAVKVDKKGKDDGKVKAGEMKAGNAVVVHYFGAYMGVSKAHEIAREYLAKNNKTKIGSPYELYITDPGMEKDTSKWQTDVYYMFE